MNREKELNKIISDARTELDEIRSTREKAKNQKLVGKCFKYENSYGSDEKWWLYGKVISVDDDGDLEFITFQECALGRIEIDVKSHFIDGSEIEISEAEFLDARAAFIARCNYALDKLIQMPTL